MKKFLHLKPMIALIIIAVELDENFPGANPLEEVDF